MEVFSEADPVPGRELAAFAAAVESGSVQRAADALGLTQSAVSKRIAALERRVGTPLLVRGRVGVAPTELGKIAYPSAKRALSALSEAAAVLGAGEAGARPTLKMAASLTIGEFLLPGWLSSFRARRPDLLAQLEIVNSTAVIESLRVGRAEIGFVEGLDDCRGWRTLTVAHDELVIAVAATHRWARRATVAVSELEGEPYLTRERSSGTREVAEVALTKAGIELTPMLQAASLQSLKRAVSNGGFTIVSALAIEAEVLAGTLVGVRLNEVSLTRELRALSGPGSLSEGARVFWEWLAEAAVSDPHKPAAPVSSSGR